MRKFLLGGSGVEVSALCLGTANFGAAADRAAAFRLLDLYREAGGSFIDTASDYAEGRSESLIGDWMKDRRARAEIFLATKVGTRCGRVKAGLRARQVVAGCERSLRRLRTDRIDLFYAHRDDAATPPEETLSAFARLVRDGKARLLGASNFPCWRLEEHRWAAHVRGLAWYCCLQLGHTYLKPRAGARFEDQMFAGDEAFSYCRARDLRLLAYSPLLAGAYTRPDRVFPPQFTSLDNRARVTVLKAVARELGATANQTVLAWMMNGGPGVIPVIAAGSETQLRENLGALKIRPGRELLARLDEPVVFRQMTTPSPEPGAGPGGGP